MTNHKPVFNDSILLTNNKQLRIDKDKISTTQTNLKPSPKKNTKKYPIKRNLLGPLTLIKKKIVRSFLYVMIYAFNIM